MVPLLWDFIVGAMVHTTVLKLSFHVNLVKFWEIDDKLPGVCDLIKCAFFLSQTLGHLEKAVVLELTLKHLKALTALTEQQHQKIIALQNGEWMSREENSNTAQET